MKSMNGWYCIVPVHYGMVNREGEILMTSPLLMTIRLHTPVKHFTGLSFPLETYFAMPQDQTKTIS
jgi:hypothetical protein